MTKNAPFPDQTDRSFLLDPFPWYARMRRESPVAIDPEGGSYVAFSFEEAWRVLGDYKVFSSKIPFPSETEGFTQGPIHMDPPWHKSVRPLVQRSFTPEKVRGMEPRITELVHELLDAVEGPLRHRSPIQKIRRFSTAGTDLGGVEIPAAGYVVEAHIGSANRDGTRFKGPEEFRIDRKPNRHIAFGQGVHSSPGPAGGEGRPEDLPGAAAEPARRSRRPRPAGAHPLERPPRRHGAAGLVLRSAATHILGTRDEDADRQGLHRPKPNFRRQRMKVLFYGAGVLGSLYAARLQEAGHDVSVLARGRRLEELREHGVVLREAGTDKRTATRVGVVERLASGDAYDLVVVIVRKNQLSSVLPALAENRSTPDVLFMLNNAAGPLEKVEALGKGRVLLGFPAAGGWLEGHEVVYLGLPGWLQQVQKTPLGELDGSASPRLERIMGSFRGAGFPVEANPNMDAWLKTHASVVVPLVSAVHATGGDVRRLSRTRDALVLTARAIREHLGVLGALGVPVTPGALRALGWLPEPLLVGLLGRLFGTETAEMGLGQHAHDSPDEARQLAGELAELSRAASFPTPAADRLRGHLDPAAPPIPEGSARISVERRATVAALTFGAAVGVLVVLKLSRGR